MSGTLLEVNVINYGTPRH